jgi:enterochelin esterase-like enzyme
MDYNLKFTTDPDGRATMGVGSAGAAAFTMAWFRPDLYRRVLVYSGAFVNRQLGIVFATPHGAWEYHEHFILNTPPRPLRIWMEVGEYDEGYTESEETLNNFVLANNRMAAALKAKGYHYRYVFAARAEYREPKVIGQTLPQAMRWLWRGYPVK